MMRVMFVAAMQHLGGGACRIQDQRKSTIPRRLKENLLVTVRCLIMPTSYSQTFGQTKTVFMHQTGLPVISSSSLKLS